MGRVGYKRGVARSLSREGVVPMSNRGPGARAAPTEVKDLNGWSPKLPVRGSGTTRSSSLSTDARRTIPGRIPPSTLHPTLLHGRPPSLTSRPLPGPAPLPPLGWNRRSIQKFRSSIPKGCRDRRTTFRASFLRNVSALPPGSRRDLLLSYGDSSLSMFDLVVRTMCGV